MSENGSGLSESQRQRIEAAQSAFFELENERTELRRLLDNTVVELRGVAAELLAIKDVHARLLGEVDTYREERDKASARRTELEVVLDAVLSVLHRYQAPQQPWDETIGTDKEGAPEGA